jgi:hypothetical protein
MVSLYASAEIQLHTGDELVVLAEPDLAADVAALFTTRRG